MVNFTAPSSIGPTAFSSVLPHDAKGLHDVAVQFFRLRKTVTACLSDNRDEFDEERMLAFLFKSPFDARLSDPSPFGDCAASSPSDNDNSARQSILSGIKHIPRYADHPELADEAKLAVLTIADELLLHPFAVLDAWIFTGSTAVVRDLEAELHWPAGSLANDRVQATKQLLEADRFCVLDTLQQLVGRRCSSDLPAGQRRIVLRASNLLLHRKLLLNILASLRHFAADIKRGVTTAAQAPALRLPAASFAARFAPLLADVAFSCIYRTHVDISELQALIETLAELNEVLGGSGFGVPSSATIMEQDPTRPYPQSDVNAASDSSEQAALAALVTLQLAAAHALVDARAAADRRANVRALNEAGPLRGELPWGLAIDRAALDAPPFERSADELPILRPSASDASRLLAAFQSGSRGPRGFLYLALAAALLSQLQDEELTGGPLPSAATYNRAEDALKQACTNRGYSYARLVLLPALQARCVGTADSRPRMVAALLDVLTATMDLLTIGRANLRVSTGAPFFVPDPEPVHVAGYGMGDSSVAVAAVLHDSITDYLELLQEFASFCPPFADCFFQPQVPSHSMVTHDDASDEAYSGASHLPIVARHHPLLDELVRKAPARLLTPTRRLLAALASSGGVRAIRIFELLQRTGPRHQQLSWTHCWDALNAFAVCSTASLAADSSVPSLNRRLALAAADRMKPFHALAYSADTDSGQQLQLSQQQEVDLAFQLEQHDRDGHLALHGLLELVLAILQNPELARRVLDGSPLSPTSSSYSSSSSSARHASRPIAVLFRVMSCPIPIELKGLVVKAVAAFARASSAAALESMEHLDRLRLLPPSPSFSLLAAPPSVRTSKGLREELEGAEVEAGKFPLSDAFLELLRALCLHANEPNGYQEEFLRSCVDFAIDDILLNVPQRSYAPDAAAGQAQRWKLTARGFEALTAVLANYWPHSDDADFHESLVTSTTTTSASNIPAGATAGAIARQVGFPRRKSAGFAVMAQLLGRMRLLEMVVACLRDCSAAGVEAEHDRRRAEVTEGSLDAMRCVPIIRISEPSQSGHQQILMPFQQVHHPHFAAMALGDSDDLSGMRFSPTSCEGAYWMQRAASSALSLLLEASRRDQEFVSAILDVKQPLTLVLSQHGRPVVVPLLAQSLADTLAQALSLSHILQHVETVADLGSQQGAEPWFYAPGRLPTAALAIELAKFVSQNTPPEVALAALASPIDNAIEEHQTLSTDVQDCLRRSCALALIFGGDRFDPMLPFVEEDIMECLEVPFGAGIDWLSAWSSETVITRPANCSELPTSLRESLLLLLMSVPSSGRFCLAHHLLGFVPSGASLSLRYAGLGVGLGLGTGNATQVSLNIASAIDDASNGMAVDCLQATLRLLSPSTDWLSDDCILPLLAHRPREAVLCYELLHRVAANPYTSQETLRALRSWGFLTNQLRAFRALLSTHLAGIPLDARASVRNALAWLLEICALEARCASTASAVNVLEPLLQVLFLPDNAEGGVVAGSGLLVLALSFAAEDAAVAPTLTGSLPQHLHRSVASVLDGCRTTISWCSATLTSTTHLLPAYDLQRLRKLLTETSVAVTDVEAVLTFAAHSNALAAQQSAIVHLALAWRQILSVLLVQPATREVLLAPQNAELVIRDAVLPPLELLARRRGDSAFSEQLAQALVPALAAVTEQILQKGSSRCLPVARHRQLLSLLIQAMVPAHGLSHDLRRDLAVALSGILSLPQRRLANSNSLQQSKTSYIRNSSAFEQDNKFAFGAFSDEERRQFSDTNLEVIEPLAVDLALALGHDASFASRPANRTVAMAALSEVLLTLGPCRTTALDLATLGQLQLISGEAITTGAASDVLGSHMFQLCLQQMHTRGFLARVMSFLRPFALAAVDAAAMVAPATPPPAAALRRDEHDDLLEGALVLCTHVATCTDGAALLLAGGLLTQLSHLQDFRQPPPCAEDAALLGVSASALQKEVETSLRRNLLPTLRLLCTLAATSQQQPVLDACSAFVQDRHATFSYLLRLRLRTPLGLQLAESAAMLLRLVGGSVALSIQQDERVQENGLHSGYFGLWDALVRDASALLKFAGQHTVDQLQLQHNTSESPINFETMLRLGVNLAAFLRARADAYATLAAKATAVALTSQHRAASGATMTVAAAARQSLLSVDLRVLADAFCMVAVLQTSPLESLPTDSKAFVSALSLTICENLVCTLLAMVSMAGPTQVVAWAGDLDRCTIAAEQITCSPFIAEAMRRLRAKRRGNAPY